VFQTAFISGDTNKTAAIVLSLVEPLLEKGRTLWMDNFYNSPALAQRLKTLKTVLEPCILVGKTFHKGEREEAQERRIRSSTFRTGVRSEVERQKRRDNDFNLPWRGKMNEANEM